jgi:metal-responsive CopG/Arc/MetJ family transcriptional regulator
MATTDVIGMEKNKRNIKTSVILSPKVMEILDLLVEGHVASSRSEAIDKIVEAWAKSDAGKKTIADAREWKPFG